MTIQPDIVITLSMGAVAFVKITVDTFAYAFDIEGKYKIPFAMFLGAIFSVLIVLVGGGQSSLIQVWPACILAGVLSGSAASGMTELQKKVQEKQQQQKLLENATNGNSPSGS